MIFIGQVLLTINSEYFDIIMYTEFGTTYNSYVMKAGDKNSSFRDCKSEVFLTNIWNIFKK